VHNHVIGARAEEGQQKKKEACIQTGEERSRSFIHGKRNLRQRSRKRGGGGGVGGGAGGRGRDAGRRPLRFDRGSRIYPIVEAIVDRPRRNKNSRGYDRSRSRSADRRSDWSKLFAGPFRSSGTVLRSRGVRLCWPIPDSCRPMRYVSFTNYAIRNIIVIRKGNSEPVRRSAH